MIAPNEATARQIQAADPGTSTWLSANAGSGKTRVLTDRVARLLLDGASPQNILCLTYTKAAASEMQNRLFRRLGEWAMTPDAGLRAELGDLGLGGAEDIGAERLAQARTLFARAIETPGGLKIQTIHSFCAALLRRFPLEAGVSPQFTEMDERAARLLTDEIVEEMAETLAPDVIDGLARHYTGEDFSALIGAVSRYRDRFLPPLDDAAIFGRFGLAPGSDAETLVNSVFLGSEHALFSRLLPVLSAGTVTDKKAAAALGPVNATNPGLGDLAICEGVMLFGGTAKSPFGAKTGSFPTKATRGKLGDDIAALDNLMMRVESARDRRLCLIAAKKSIALHRFAQIFLPLYEDRKLARGWLDFEDLILKARGLLTDPAVAQWVLFRLDGGIDHILVDEAQDTSPAQWSVIERLTQEFSAGDGLRSAGERSLFVVGDRKQSIYSFQGADPDEFERMYDRFRDRLSGTAPLQRLELQHSFRSSGAVLSVVDAVFGGEGDGPLDLTASHRAFHDGLPGRVDLWPILLPEDEDEDADWTDPVDRVSPNAADVRLARAIAGEIRRMIDDKETVPAQGGTRRPVHAGDFLILVQRRKRLFNEIIRACKQQRLDIAGADRLKLGAELAVRDLRALLSFLATPEDDLSLAAALRSPLFGWSEAELYGLAAERSERYLWQALRNRRAEFPATLAVIDALRKDADFLRPYDLLDRIMLRHRGRANLLARLGDEAQDGLDELLNQALAYERMDIPSLTGFLAWLDADDVEVKRQADSAGSRIRVMSVHGAKGLEAPIVILPDTLRKKTDIRDEVFPADDGTPLWRTRADEMPELLKSAKAGLVEGDDAERARLLYVAMTRAETWLIVCGAGNPPTPSWYGAVEQAMSDMDFVRCTFPTGDGIRLSHGDWTGGVLVERQAKPALVSMMPGWVARPAPLPAVIGPALIPSGLGGAKALPGEMVPELRDEAMERGTAIHLLLEHLPGHAPELWPAMAARLVGDERSEETLEEVRPSLISPELADLFGAEGLSEVELSAHPGGQAMNGIVDRLIVTADRVLAVDYKSNRLVPETAQAVPEGVLRQLGLYAAALAEIFPDRAIETAILWTRTATLMPVPAALSKAALLRALTATTTS